MASEIRVNSLSSRAGLSTVTFTDTGPIFSGITTFQDNSGFNVGTGGSIFSPASNTLAVGTNSAERLRIDSAGRLKVGTTNDIIWNQTSEDGVVIEQSGATQIVRNGDVPLLVTRNTSTGQIVKFSQAGTERGSILYDGDFGIASAGNLTFDISGTERLRISSSGNIGIGTDNPLTKTHIDGTNGDNSTLFITASDLDADYGGAISLGGNYDGTNKTAFSQIKGLKDNNTSGEYGGYLSFLTRTNGQSLGERLRITSAGDMGLGTASPTSFGPTLQVAGTDPALLLQDTATAVDYFGMNIASGAVNTWFDDASAFVIHTATGLAGSGLAERLRITSGGDLLLGGQTAYTYDDTGASNTILDIANSANNKRGILSLSGNSNANGPSIGTIWFNNDQNSGTGPGATMKLAAAIQAKAVTSDSNAGDDSGAYLQFLTKPESAALAESMVIHSDGEVIKSKQPGFFTRRAVGGDGRAAQAQEWSVAGTGSFNTGNHFNASNGRFTAPVAGKYIFTAAPGYKQTSYDYNFKFLINGGQQSEPVRVIDGGDDLTSHSGFTGTVIYNLNANDYVQVEVGYIHHVNLTYNFFMGYLLG